jgi:hypothetical protein
MAYDGTTPQKNFWIRFAAQDRVTLLPDSLVAPLQEHLQYVKRLHEDDLARGCGAVHLPEALDRKCPHANEEWAWQYIFPSQRLSVDPSAAKGQRREKPLRWRLALLGRAVGARPNWLIGLLEQQNCHC